MEIKTLNVGNSNNTSIDTSFLFHTADIPLWKEIAKDFSQRFTHIFVFGVGGSSLAGQVLVQFGSKAFPKVKFIDSPDEDTMRSIKALPTASTAFVFITKSGETLETIFQANYCLEYLSANGLPFKDHCLIITMEDTPLWHFAKRHEIKTILHPDVCGRFSCFTVVAILPALLAGVEIDEYLEGGIEQARIGIDEGFAKQMLEEDIHIVMPYTTKLSTFTEWYSQLTAESLSKEGKGYCVVRTLGTKDQHNQLQMFLDGKNNKTYTFIGIKTKAHETIPNIIQDVLLPQGTWFSCIMQAGMHGVAKELSSRGRKVRIIEFDEITPKEVGKLFMLYMQEVLYQASVLDVLPFTQPAVASVKKLMSDFLSRK